MSENTFENYFPYKSVRAPQADILKSLDKIYASDKKYRYIVIEAGTGIGKSAIAKAISKRAGNSYLLTATKQLQDQYEKDFYNMSVKVVKGAANYECAVDEGMRCSNGECKYERSIWMDCVEQGICPYVNAKKSAEKAEMYVTSYSYFLRATKPLSVKAKPFPKRRVIVVDECHMLEDQLINSAGFTLSKDYLDKRYELNKGLDFNVYLRYNKKPRVDGLKENEDWIKLIATIIKNKIEFFQKTIASIKHGDRSNLTAEELSDLEETDVNKLSQHINELTILSEKIDNFLNSSEKENWIISAKDGKLSVKPISVENLFHQLIDKFAMNQVVFMSATILDKPGFCKDMGLTPENTCFITKDSTFPSYNSPIVYDPIGSMSYKNINGTMPYVIDEIKRILALHPNEKGIIHTSTYGIMEKIVENINSDRLVYKEMEVSNESLMKFHANSPNPTVLVSPSLMAGVDLHDDLSRFQIIVKLPYISMADERVKRKMKNNQSWYTCKMMRNLVQECGRSTRNDKDWAVTYILDNAFMKSVKYNKKWLSNQFLNRIVDISKFNLAKFKKGLK